MSNGKYTRVIKQDCAGAGESRRTVDGQQQQEKKRGKGKCAGGNVEGEIDIVQANAERNQALADNTFANGIEMSPEQFDAYTLFKQRKNLFLTGPGGTGKSALIRHFYAKAYSAGKNVQVCALTGCAAVLLSGCNAKTVHSWAGIGIANKPIDDYLRLIRKHSRLLVTWRKTQILIIDEVSMMSAHLFEMLNTIAKEIRNDARPFGGMQVIFSGDFYQLPPVGNPENPLTTMMCFQSTEWWNVFPKVNNIELKHIYRQKDEVYQSILNDIRCGKLRKKNYQILSQRVINDDEDVGEGGEEEHVEERGGVIGHDVLMRIQRRRKDFRPTKLFPTKGQANETNEREMRKLTGETFTYESKKICSENSKHLRKGITQEQIQRELEYLEGNMRCDPMMRLKEHSQVMCVVNLDVANGICNGSQGVVIGFRRAFADFDLESATEEEKIDMGYGIGVSVGGVEMRQYPVVRFLNGDERIILPYQWKSESISGVSVYQVPLILAWAITIHKSQGMTIDEAEVDAGSGIFECGQTYVALSRVRSLEGLHLTSFDYRKILVNHEVQKFYDDLKTIDIVEVAVDSSGTEGTGVIDANVNSGIEDERGGGEEVVAIAIPVGAENLGTVGQYPMAFAEIICPL